MANSTVLVFNVVLLIMVGKMVKSTCTTEDVKGRKEYEAPFHRVIYIIWSENLLVLIGKPTGNAAMQSEMLEGYFLMSVFTRFKK